MLTYWDSCNKQKKANKQQQQNKQEGHDGPGSLI